MTFQPYHSFLSAETETKRSGSIERLPLLNNNSSYGGISGSSLGSLASKGEDERSMLWNMMALELAAQDDEGLTSRGTTESSLESSDGDALSAPPANNNAVQDPFELREKLGVIPLAVIIFYGVSGGAFGVEETVRSAGSFYTLLGFLVMPFIWSVQEALMTAEMGSAFPEASGGVAWVEEAFGDRAGWMSGYLNWVSGATDNAIYPVLFVEYVLQLVNGDSDSISPVTKFFMFSGISCALAYTNWLGLPVVGKMSITICVLAISPFVVLCIIGAFNVDPSQWLTPPVDVDDKSGGDTSVGLFTFAALGSIAWRPYMNNLFWNLNSFDNAASFSADVEDPGRVLPRALGLSVLMVGSCYFIPLLIALGASGAQQNDWVDGYFSVVAEEVAGPWLGGWLVFAAGISNIAMFQAELSSDAFQLMGMAERGYLPKIFAERSQHGTPTYGIILGTIVIVCMTVTNLDQLIEMLNFNYALALLLEYISFLKLRVSRPDLERPYRVPLGTVGCAILFTPTLLAILVIIALASFQTMLFSVAVNAFGFFIFAMRQNKVYQRYLPVEGSEIPPEADQEEPEVQGELT